MTSVPAEGTRPSDAERDRALAILREGAGTGRLSHDTFVRRMNFVLRAQSRGELADAIRDLPREEPHVTRRLRDFRTRLPRLEVIRSPSPTRPPARVEGSPGAGTSGRPSGVVGAWYGFLERLGSLPRVGVVQKTPALPPPGLALPAPGSPTVRIGRGPGASLRLADLSVSRCHAELRYVKDGWMLRDLGSMNGTQVNGLRLTTAVRVRPGDQVRFGGVAYVLTWTDQPE
ncbi:FHA domain-containing protein [Kribbella sp. NBC_00889]|uniref:FHA domain-containing protein n=1 Tax=Kribbella sp. NBC_00889 TaxID=2975974 RepID=UPI00386B6993|nr:FHA domain-containing protein [Kribbella sp. NBC_00889]